MKVTPLVDLESRIINNWRLMLVELIMFNWWDVSRMWDLVHTITQICSVNPLIISHLNWLVIICPLGMATKVQDFRLNYNHHKINLLLKTNGVVKKWGRFHISWWVCKYYAYHDACVCSFFFSMYPSFLGGRKFKSFIDNRKITIKDTFFLEQWENSQTGE